MILLFQIVFWLCLFAILYSYLIFPVIIKWKAGQSPLPYQQFEADASNLPSINILIAARNEESILSQKLDNLFDTDYPMDKIKVYIGSDASTDGTDAIVKSHQKKKIG